MRRKALFVFLLFLCSCSTTAQPWKYDSTTTSERCYDSSRLTLPVDELTLSPGLEFIKTASEERLYLYTTGKAFPKNSKITLTIDDTTTAFSGDLFAGGQRLLIPKEIQNDIVQALLKKRDCTLTIGYQRVNVSSKGFDKQWQQFASGKSQGTLSRIKLSCLMSNR